MRVARLYDMEQLRALVAPVAKDFGVRSVYAFGSYGRGQANGESDLDLRIEAGAIRSLFALADFRQTLEDRLNIPVDVVTSDIDDRDFLRAIARDEVLLYAEGQSAPSRRAFSREISPLPLTFPRPSGIISKV